MSRFNKDEQIQSDEGPFRSDNPIETGKYTKKEDAKHFSVPEHQDPNVLKKFKTPGFKDKNA